MRSASLALAGLGAVGLLACLEEPAPQNPFPEEAREAFFAMCGADAAFCACSWDGITRAMSAEDWEAAQERLVETGRVHPQIVVVSSRCREQTR